MTMESPEQKLIVEIPPLPKVRLSLPHRINCFIGLWFLKVIVRIVLFVERCLNPLPPAMRPTLVKRYACRPGLECRVFFPPDYKPGTRLPLYFNIHGGGLCFANATVDDRFCVSWAARTGMLVVSLNYRKAPLHPFPYAAHDIAALAHAVLADDSLPLDPERVAIGGFSAGAHLALSASQLPGLKGIVKAAVSYYPIVDFGHDPTYKLDTRPYRDGPRENLAGQVSWWLDWAYVSVGQNRRDPVLSPCYARKQDLPPSIYMVGAQWDILRLEAQLMIHDLAGLESKENKEESFETGHYKWTLAMDCAHGFTHKVGGDSARATTNRLQSEAIYAEAHAWLKKSVLA
ncbi:Alpha/Beta hydrolase protein [Penicillium hispanicum]|uniref:Alpha/Beta hydrolase protein n=1 Tax=Penicillium hispanicum TaxID=1080232 RepID=UPI0025418C65|nr:Alpha/Beta hydrolase protein [Penicillium hispanicum]KAJ5585260.1 Alpha/Beta hydrolase protein [Penicillium hispanicum]